MSQIETYHFGHIVIDGQDFHQDVIILPHRIIESWWRQEGHVLLAQDLKVVFETSPDILVVGQGAYGRMKVPLETQEALRTAGIELIALPTQEACQTYNELREGRVVSAALHLTC